MLESSIENITKNTVNKTEPDWFNYNWLEKWEIISIHVSEYLKQEATEKIGWGNIPFAFKSWDNWYIEDYWVNPMSLWTRYRKFDELPREYKYMHEALGD